MKHLFCLNIITSIILGISVVCSANVIHVPTDYSTIQAGIDAASDGDTVLVADGTYSGEGNYDISLNGKMMTLMSENGKTKCVIDSQGLGSGVYAGAESSVIRGFTIMGAPYDWGYGGVVSCGGGGVVADCLIESNGIGVDSEYYDGPPDILKNCIIRNNNGYGFYLSGFYSFYAAIYVVDCLVYDNNGYEVYSDLDSGCDFFNCYFRGDLFVYYNAGIDLYNCTVQGEVGGYVDSYIGMNNTIVWPGYIYGTESTYYNIRYSNIPGDFSGQGNIHQDPMFVTGPDGDFYLSSIAGGQADDSPCIDTGSDSAESICDPWQVEPLCMSTLTTRTDEAPDAGIVDMGFHFPYEHQPTPTPTPEPTVTPNEEGVNLILNGTYFQAGDKFKLRAECVGPAGQDVDLYVIMDVFGSLFFYPDWSQSPSCAALTISDEQMNYIFILDFVWPEGDFGHADGLRFWSAMCYAGSTELLGKYDFVEFGY